MATMTTKIQIDMGVYDFLDLGAYTNPPAQIGNSLILSSNAANYTQFNSDGTTVTDGHKVVNNVEVVTYTDGVVNLNTLKALYAADNYRAIENLFFANNDKITGSAFADQLKGLAGNDKLIGGKGDDRMLGGDGNDNLSGQQGADNLNGGDGNDTLNGGVGFDVLTGGAGRDKFVLNASGLANYDRISDFTVADDTIQLDNAFFTHLGADGALAANAFKIGSAATNGNQHIIYDDTNGKLFYDADGSGAGAQQLIARLDTGLDLSELSFQII